MLTGGWKGAGGRGKPVTKGGEDADDKRKNKAGQKRLGSKSKLRFCVVVYWFGASPPRNANRQRSSQGGLRGANPSDLRLGAGRVLRRRRR